LAWSSNVAAMLHRLIVAPTPPRLIVVIVSPLLLLPSFDDCNIFSFPLAWLFLSFFCHFLAWCHFLAVPLLLFYFSINANATMPLFRSPFVTVFCHADTTFQISRNPDGQLAQEIELGGGLCLVPTLTKTINWCLEAGGMANQKLVGIGIQKHVLPGVSICFKVVCEKNQHVWHRQVIGQPHHIHL